MGTYLNPGNRGFIEIRNGTYVDKTGLIGQINETIGTKEKLICISRPRRFGKSYATQMLCAYYDKTCDSSELFDDLAIAVDERWNGGYCQHLNQYDVIYLDMTNLMGEAGEEGIVAFIRSKVTEELTAAYPQLETDESFSTTLIRAVELTGNKFVMIIDEWDAPIRETPGIQKEYLRFLRTLFKGSGTTDKIFAAVYMTGILPIKKDGSQSAISDFQEYSMVFPGAYESYVGFTDREVKALCEASHCDYDKMKFWYDGYLFSGTEPTYNPNSVMKAVRNQRFRSYWTETSASKSLTTYISLDYDGLSKTVAELIGGGEVAVDTYGFANDLVSFQNRDDVLTLLIHLGYLSYDDEAGRARIPNEEIRLEFVKMIRRVKRDDTIRRVRESDQLILDTIQGKEEAVAAQIERIHEEESPLHYHGEQALRSVVKRAYFSYGDEYMLFEEFPSGAGYADILYLPRKHSPLPALLIELKWNQSAEGAIAQIKERNYPQAVKDFGGELLLVGISYDKDAAAGQRKHSCVIEPYRI